MRLDELSRELVDLAQDGTTGGPTPADRLAAIDSRVEGLRRWRTARRTVAVGVATAVALAAFVMAPGPGPSHGGTETEKPDLDKADTTLVRPPALVGFQLPARMQVNDVPYQYYRSEQSSPGARVLRVAIAASRQPQALAWATPAWQPGRVLVEVDGNTVSRDRAGGLASTLLLSPRRLHVIVLRVTQPITSTTIGLAIYQWPPPGGIS